MTQRKTRVLPVTAIQPPHVDSETSLLDWWYDKKDSLPQDQVSRLLEAARVLQTSSVPVAFPTETVYGLGADATRSEAVRGIYAAKQRPSDNPLIVHVGSLGQLRALLQPPLAAEDDRCSNISHVNGTIPTTSDQNDDPIPPIYQPLIRKLWPGPLTLLFPLPKTSPFAPEVTTTLSTVGIRMPSSPLARLLISLSNRPLAAPSANASTRPSPTTAAHVLHDLDGRIEMILDGGSCEVGVESTVVDGLCYPPAVLRPGGVGFEEIRRLGGVWTDVVVGYQDRDQWASVNGDGKVDAYTDGSAVQTNTNGMHGRGHVPRAPGMKYRHYAPRARVHLFEDPTSSENEARSRILSLCNDHLASPSQPAHPDLNIGVITTQTWRPDLGLGLSLSPPPNLSNSNSNPKDSVPTLAVSTFHIANSSPSPSATPPNQTSNPNPNTTTTTTTTTTPPTPPSKHHQMHSLALGPAIEDVARGLFSALRELDARGCDVILIEGVEDGEEDAEESAGASEGL
ncbi:hypothetical protein EPUS_07942 [Endocarpon pusillum Z07020]|uniref:Threonylcarbamoyl-AMP synthase n=1 Tax=Endocarpon pusillum (strain Z07020 / HMAS-L-300199) TaxID=1263415 RepID=U1GY23_ENDPU|nr:uncharacterized protein EPUS_07942 [Endocarpon pusillum Z07020]ERF77036.1 hypothetical protein EPUS_07942 [Endocarpon pusillum Z07020]